MLRRAEEGPTTVWERLEEAERFYMGAGKVHETIRQLAADLDRAKIDHALIGAMALNAHGYSNRPSVRSAESTRPQGSAVSRLNLADDASRIRLGTLPIRPKPR